MDRLRNTYENTFFRLYTGMYFNVNIWPAATGLMFAVVLALIPLLFNLHHLTSMYEVGTRQPSEI
jgi:hypothetical protein